MLFRDLDLDETLLKAVSQKGYSIPTEIQRKVIPVIVKGSDLLASSQTGTGKTAAFVLPLLQKHINGPFQGKPGKRQVKTLILTPTRELALQVSENISSYSKYIDIKHSVIYGGISQQTQVKSLTSGIDILVATPGRLMDLLQQGYVNLSSVQHFVLDEADRMLDSGFLNDIKRIVKLLPKVRQTLLFSATLPKEIRELSSKILNNAELIEVHPVSSTAEKIHQSVYYVEKHLKQELLLDLLGNHEMERVLVFTTMKHHADKLANHLKRSGISSEAIHGNKSQRQRQDTLDKFKNRKVRVLIATDVVARGIDIDNLSHVINYELPLVAETYVHRIGRTGRKGNKGTAISFCASHEKVLLKDIQSLISRNIPVVHSSLFNRQISPN